MNHTFTQKILAGAIGAAMVLSSVAGVAVSFANAQTADAMSSYNFTRSLTVGSSGADVTALQQLLSSGGFLTVSPTGYFGSLTKAALAQWQASVGISPASGYFGPLTRAYIATHGTVPVTTGPTGTPGCPAGAMYNTMTGQPCTSSAPTPGCPAGALYNSMTGQPCSTSSTPVTPSGTEGTLTLTLAGNPANNGNILTNVDVPVWGLQAQAQLGNVTISRLDLDVQDNNSGSMENPANFVNTVKVWDGSNVLVNRPVSTADFVQGTSSTDYYIRLSGINFVVPQGQTKTLVVSFSTNGGIDNNRVLTIQGYPGNSSNLLTVSGNNVSSFYNVSGSSFTRTQTFVKPGVATLSLGIDGTNPLSAANYVDPSTGSQGITTLAFNGQSTSGDSKITNVSVTPTYTTTGSGQAPSTVYLYDGSTLLASQGVSSSGTAVNFNNLTDVVSAGTSKVLTVKVDVPAYTSGSTTVSTTLSSLTYQKPNGSSVVLSPSLAGNTQNFYTAIPNLTFLSGTATAGPANTSGSNQNVSGTFVFKVHPQGGQMVQPVASDFTVKLGTTLSGATTVAAGSTTIVSITPTPSSSTTPLSQGTDYTITLSAIAANGLFGLNSTGIYQFYLTNASTTVTDPNGHLVATQQSFGLDNFKSGTVSFNK